MTDLSWYGVAYNELGIKEIAGLTHNPRIIEYHSATTLHATTDEVPWCSSFVNWCFKTAGYTGTRRADAKSWMNWGEPATAVRGAVCVLTRTGGGHVGFFVREDDRFVWLLGGNQSNEVNISPYPKTRILGYRMPKQMNDEDLGLYQLIARGLA